MQPDGCEGQFKCRSPSSEPPTPAPATPAPATPSPAIAGGGSDSGGQPNPPPPPARKPGDGGEEATTAPSAPEKKGGNGAALYAGVGVGAFLVAAIGIALARRRHGAGETAYNPVQQTDDVAMAPGTWTHAAAGDADAQYVDGRE